MPEIRMKDRGQIHQVVLAYDIMTEKEGEYVAQFFTTFAITPTESSLLTQHLPEVYETDKTMTKKSKI